MIQANDVITEALPFTAEVKSDIAIYLPAFYHSEVGVAKRLQQIRDNHEGIRINTNSLESRVAARTRMHYDEIQMQAIRTAAENKVFILTGGPGTGKTTTTRGIITALRDSGARIILAAPTGRAAKRLSEATGMEAKTIHRLLEAKPPEGYQRNEDNPLEGDVLIIDECSMIDIMLAYSLLKAVPDRMKLILVGDVDQLPSVGPGNVLRDIIDSDCFPVVQLTKIFRQAQTSKIIMNAHRINQGKFPDISNGSNTDFFFVDMEATIQKKSLDENDTAVLSNEAASEIVNLIINRLPKYFRMSPAEIQVLTPMQRGVVGAAALNQSLQEVVNPGGEGLRRGGYIFKPKDKVMQIKNNYEKEVFNGDIGIIRTVDLEERNLIVDYEGRMVQYEIVHQGMTRSWIR